MASEFLSGWSRRIATRQTRRSALGAAGVTAAGLLGITAARAQDDDVSPPETGLGDDGVCRMAFEGTVRLGPSNAGGEPLVLQGLLSFVIGSGGALNDGTLVTDAATYAVRGQGNGRALTLRITTADGQTFIAVGSGHNSARSCSGEYGGPASGPVRGDLGDWIATAARREDAGQTATATITAETTPVPTEAPEPPPTEAECAVVCDSPYVLDDASCSCVCDVSQLVCSGGKFPDPAACACICEEPYFPTCGDICCPDGQICIDAGSGTCACPNGGEVCAGGCTDLLTDEYNCGACGVECGFGRRCESGECKVLDLNG